MAQPQLDRQFNNKNCARTGCVHAVGTKGRIMEIFGRQTVILLLVGLFAAGTLQAASPTTYTIQALGFLSGQGSLAYGVNDNGVAVG